MHQTNWLGRVALFVAALSLYSSGRLFAESPSGDQVAGVRATGATPAVVDVALAPGGVFRGQAIDPQGAAQSSALVVLLQGGREVAEVTADRQGAFQILGVRGGVYEVSTAGGTTTVRLWNEGTAPPAAGQALMLVTPRDVIAGQGGGALQALKSPWVAAGLISAAIAVPIALNNNGPGS